MAALDPITLQLIALALEEDAARDDLTAQATIPPGKPGKASIRAKANGVLSGVTIAEHVFRSLDTGISIEWKKRDGDAVAQGDRICALAGDLRALLAAERTALNFLQHLSGIATATRAFVEAVRGTGCAIVDTRKTVPGMRLAAKRAVLHGGGVNHRENLAGGMLIKENHIEGCGSIARAIAACRAVGKRWVEVECETLAQVRKAVAAQPDIILLDNMDPAQVRKARALVPREIVLEASGNITLANVREYAQTGVDRLAIGSITHSAPALDLSMRVESS
ncbi:MAG: carboxylating nicotinate-nucleotide diphosphorylase [Zetaproteobacteria bacterium]|nr:MAG: carboxylating nicotinate-nucleotide diphosphorylase [Zetaproteobacteria bacterium]